MALLYVADHMVEPMAPRRPEDSDTTFARYLAKYGEGFHSFELRIDDAIAAAEACRRNGLNLATVYPTFFFVHPSNTGGIVVQLCGKQLENDPKDYRGWRDDWMHGHPSGLLGLDHIACIIRDAGSALDFFTGILDGEILSDEPCQWPQPCRRILMRLGDTSVALIAADDPSTGPVGEYLSRPASGVYALVWRTESLAAAREYFEWRGAEIQPATLSAEGLTIDPAAMAGARHEFIEVHGDSG